jgi:hypothetical protein
MYKTL